MQRVIFAGRRSAATRRSSLTSALTQVSNGKDSCVREKNTKNMKYENKKRKSGVKKDFWPLALLDIVVTFGVFLQGKGRICVLTAEKPS